MVPPELTEGLRWPLWYAPSTSNRLPQRSTLNWTESGGITPGAFSPGGRAAGGRRAGHIGLPSGPLAEALVQRDPEGTAEPGDPASQSLPRYGTWWASSPTDSRRSVWWARCWPSSMTSGPKPADFGTHPGVNHQRRKQSGRTGDAEEHRHSRGRRYPDYAQDRGEGEAKPLSGDCRYPRLAPPHRRAAHPLHIIFRHRYRGRMYS